MHKVRYFVCYDYGQGSLWACVEARSENEIVAKYPELQVFAEPPSFFNKPQLDMITSNLSIDIDDDPKGWLKELVEKRNEAR